MSRYDDPRWYEEQDTKPPRQPAYNGFNPYPQDDLSKDDTIYPQQQNQQQSLNNARRRPGRILGRIVAVTALVIIAFFGGWFSHQLFGNTFNQSAQSASYAQMIQQAWTTIDQNYVDRKAVNYKQMAYQAITAMTTSLNDKGHTRFLTPGQVQSENQQLSGSYTGVGFYLRQDPKTKQLIITSTIPGSPAEKAGFKRGDIILAVDGKSTNGKDIAGLSTLIQGKAGTSVAITVQRAGVQQPITIRVTRAEIKVPNVLMHYIAQDHIAHIQIVQFADGVSNQLKDTIGNAKKMGARKIILDLRDDPGGFLNEAINTASQFISKGTVLLEQDSSGQRTSVQVTGNTTDTTDTIVVLVNADTASAAEIVSGALHDNNRATIIGEKTFGTGTVLQQFPLSDGSAILLGTQEWLTPKGQFIRDHGIQPDTVVTLGQSAVPLTPQDENAGNLTEQQILGSGDAQLVAAIKYLETH